ncbi:MAG: MFS transporter [Candidatus Acidiferrales bacterium]
MRNAATLNGSISSAVPISNSRRWSIVGLLFTASLINYVDRGTISVALPLIARDFHFGPEIKGALLAAFFASYALMQVPVGWAVDHLNLRRFFAIMFLIWCAAQGLTGLATGLGMLIFFRLLLGIGESIYFPGGVKIVSVLFAPADRGLPTGIFNCGIKAGLAVGAPLTALLIQRFGWRHMFLIIGLVALLWLVPWLAVFPSRFPKHYKHSSETDAAPPPGSRRFVTFDRNLVGICLGFFCWDYYFYLFLTWLPDYLMTVRHFRMLAAGLFAALPYLVFMVAEPLGGWIADRLIRYGWSETIARKSIVTVAFLCGIFLIFATHVQSPTHALWLIAGAGLAGFGAGNVVVFPQSCAPGDQVGIWTGFMNFAGNVGGVIAPVATGFLIARTGSYSPGFAIGPVLLIVGILCYWFIVGKLEPRRHAADASHRA